MDLHEIGNPITSSTDVPEGVNLIKLRQTARNAFAGLRATLDATHGQVRVNLAEFLPEHDENQKRRVA